jgi:hypothetical protein
MTRSAARRWRFWTVSAPGDPEAAGWVGKDIAHGGAPTWMTGTYDPELDMLYWTTGNPAKEYDATDRQGDNLYSHSVIALDPKTGKLKWYYQFTPHDTYDYDSTETLSRPSERGYRGDSNVALSVDISGKEQGPSSGHADNCFVMAIAGGEHRVISTTGSISSSSINERCGAIHVQLPSVISVPVPVGPPDAAEVPLPVGEGCQKHETKFANHMLNHIEILH